MRPADNREIDCDVRDVSANAIEDPAQFRDPTGHARELSVR